MRRNLAYVLSLVLVSPVAAWAQAKPKEVPVREMQQVYEEVKTPHKYGLVLVTDDNQKKLDCPSVFRKGNQWYMTYIIFDGRGYETWLAQSKDLLKWETKGKLLSFTDTTDWDTNQKAGYVALQDYKWGGSYQWQPYQGKYWMSYFGGNSRGYEKGLLSIGMAYTTQDPSTVHSWQRLPQPVLKANDPDARWWENHTIYKSSVIWDKAKLTGHPFVMYYNANGDSLDAKRGAERIGMAVSDDMTHWQRFRRNPVINHHKGISGDAYLQQLDNGLWVMFYFGAFYLGISGAVNRFACSYDLVNWTDWTGANLIEPSEPYDELFAHKSFVVKYEGVVYHYYCAVNKADQRGIAVATSKDLGKSSVHFIVPDPKPAKKAESK
ncbi:glycoside hydrolase family protein [Hymenobacter crusticola]|uniref:Glycosylase n=1 Tax=Hymenobacter crusticola TaxID=1770526 RepID=A0A243W642_9BACT|nr:glycosylase [Hymenobacter crusticola]OUJ69787.1 glycosylase [Hymenobacter crusticola]